MHLQTEKIIAACLSGIWKNRIFDSLIFIATNLY